MKDNSSGFSIVEVLLIFVVLAIIGGTGFYVYRANKDTKETLNNTGNSDPASKKQSGQEQSENEKEEPEKYSNSEYGYEFEYPKLWKTSDAAGQRGTTPGYPNVHSVTLESPDFVATSEGIGYHLTSGAEMYVRVDDTDQSNANEYMQTLTFMNKVITDRKNMEVAGHPALRYKLHYEGSPSLGTVVVFGGKAYTINLNYADEAALNKYKNDYEDLVRSFELAI